MSSSSRTFAEEAYGYHGQDVQSSPAFTAKKIQVEFATPDPKAD